MKIDVIVQARMGSSRLPGKVLKPILGRPMLAYQIERLRRISGIDQIVIATSVAQADDAVADLAGTLPDVTLSRGSEADVLARYHQAATECRSEAIVRITADCPLIDPGVSSRVIQAFVDRQGEIDYASNILTRTYSKGLDTEVFLMGALERAFREAREPYDREHVTPYFYRNPDQFRLLPVVGSPDTSHYRWTVDTQDDFEFVARIYSELYETNPTFTYGDVLELLDRRPEMRRYNAVRAGEAR